MILIVSAVEAVFRRVMNYFEAFGIPVGYKINEEVLVRNYLQRQSQIYPDMDVTESEKSSHINVAYKILSQPIDRAKYFLEIHGKYTDSLDPEFASEMFSMREKYEALSTPEEKKNFQDELSKRIRELIETLEKSEEDLDKFQKFYGLLRFTNSFLEKIDFF
jgi:DnaJ-domain-containing protein 1